MNTTTPFTQRIGQTPIGFSDPTGRCRYGGTQIFAGPCDGTGGAIWELEVYDYYLETGEVPGDYVGEIDEIEYSPEGTGEQVPLGEYIEQDAADLVVGMVEATGDAYVEFGGGHFRAFTSGPCLLYTSDAADESSSV